MSTEPLRLGIVGCGRLAEAGYVPASALVPGARVVAVADPDPARRSQVVSVVAAGLPSGGGRVAEFADATAMVEGGAVDAIVLATPVATHVADATVAVEAGIPVLVEKPPAVDGAGTAHLQALGPLVSIGFNRRFDPGARHVRSRLPRSGPLDLRLELGYRRASWGALAVRDEVLLDLMPHLVDWARWLTGSEVADVTATEISHDRARLELTLGRGRATLLAVADSIHRERIEVLDHSGDRLARHRTGGLVAAVVGRVRPQRGPHPLVVSLADQLRAFARVAGGGRDEVLATAADGHAVMTAIDAARLSAARGGQTIPVNDPSEHVPC